MMKFTLLVGLLFSQLAAADLVIYSDATPGSLQTLATEFTARTGQKVQIVELAYPAMKARLQAEAETSTADLLYTKDVMYTADLANLGWFQAFNSEVVKASIPAELRSSKDLWAAMNFKVRTVVYNSSVINGSEISQYTDLADKKWAGRICLRSGKHAYNQALISNFVLNMGAEKATDFLKSLIANLSGEPLASDRAVIDAIVSGTCDVGIVNHYYLAPYIEANPGFVVKPAFMNQASSGVHTNGSSIGIAKTSKQAELATKFIELMTEDSFQLSVSAPLYYFPAKKGLLPSSIVKNWGAFKTETASWEQISTKLPTALKIIEDVQYR